MYETSDLQLRNWMPIFYNIKFTCIYNEIFQDKMPSPSTFAISEIHRKTEPPKRPNFLPIKLMNSPSRIPSGTDSRDLPGKRPDGIRPVTPANLVSGQSLSNENRMLRLRIQKLEEKQAKFDDLQSLLDRLQVSWSPAETLIAFFLTNCDELAETLLSTR